MPNVFARMHKACALRKNARMRASAHVCAFQKILCRFRMGRARTIHKHVWAFHECELSRNLNRTRGHMSELIIKSSGGVLLLLSRNVCAPAIGTWSITRHGAELVEGSDHLMFRVYEQIHI